MARQVTHVRIKNIGDDNITFYKYKNWSGNADGGNADPYPKIIAPDNIGEFDHRNLSQNGGGSIGAVVYRGKNGSGQDYDWVYGWFNSDNPSQNKAYTEVRDSVAIANNYGPDYWTNFHRQLTHSSTAPDPVRRDGCTSEVSIASENLNVQLNATRGTN